MTKKITTANANGLTRLQAVEKVQRGATLTEVAKEYNVHYTTVKDWLNMYESGGVDRLNTYRKPRPKKPELNKELLQKQIETAKPQYMERLNILLEIANGAKIRDLSKKYNKTEQAILQARRYYVAGKFPK